MLEQPLVFTGCSSIQFQFTVLSQTQSVRPHLVAFTSLCSPCVTYGRLCHTISHQVLPTQPLPREAEDFLGVASASAHIANLHPTKRCYLVGSVYVLRAATEYFINLSLLLNNYVINSSIFC